MLPSDGARALEDAAFDLISSANALAGQIHPIVTESVGNLVRSMNGYYSNLIEGHDTHPRDIDRALQQRKCSNSATLFDRRTPSTPMAKFSRFFRLFGATSAPA